MNAPPKIVVAHSNFDIKSFVDAWPEPTDCVWAKNRAELLALLPEVEILVTMTLWEPHYFDLAPKLRLVQAMSSGVDLYDIESFRQHDVHLASARGVNANAVAQHALAMMLALTRHLPQARDDQQKSFWRKWGGEVNGRRRELGDSHVVIVGFGDIGKRLASLCLALGQRVTVVRRHITEQSDMPVQVVGQASLADAVKEADYLILACPATPEIIGLVDHTIFNQMKKDASLINVARGSVVVEEDLISALRNGQIASAGLDTFRKEPLPPESPLWGMSNVIITPHVAGDTTAYEQRVAAILRQNVTRLMAGEPLINQIV